MNQAIIEQDSICIASVLSRDIHATQMSFIAHRDAHM
jgi:hypothetical protein